MAGAPSSRRTFAPTLPDFSYWRSNVPCLSRCPVHTNARSYIEAAGRRDFEDAYLIARAPNPFASMCGHICGAPCELSCRRGRLDEAISIRAIKRFVTEEHAFRRDIRHGFEGSRQRQYLIERFSKKRSGSGTDVRALADLDRATPGQRFSVGIIGSGPAGLACAHDLAVLGHDAVVYEMERVAGGMLFLGVPAYRLPRDVIMAEIDLVRMMGVKIATGVEVGRDVTLEKLRERHDRVVVAIGAKSSRSLRLPGIDAEGVRGGVEFLRDIALGNEVGLGARVVVIGGGNVAYDVSRTAVRHAEEDVARSAMRRPFVSQVTLCCLEALDEMPADVIEIEEGEEEGITRMNRLGPKEILKDGNGRVRGVLLQRATQVFDEDGRFAPVFDPDDTVELLADTVFLTVGQRSDYRLLSDHDDIVMGDNWRPVVDENGRTSAHDVFLAGDAATGPGLMIEAIASGKGVALAIHGDAVGRRLHTEPEVRFSEVRPFVRDRDYHLERRRPVPKLDAQRRIKGFHEMVELGFDGELTQQEARRCLDCAVFPVFDGERCVQCGGCMDACPHRCLYLVDLARLEHDPGLERLFRARYGSADSPVPTGRAIIKDDSTCIRCGICADRCPVRAITMERLEFVERHVLGAAGTALDVAGEEAMDEP